MSDYISREMACAYNPPEKRLRKYGTYNLDDAFEDGYDEHIKQVEAIPAADVRPVVRGKWMKPKGFKTRCQCSECKVHPVRGEPNFCPNCGADMRGEQSAL